MIDISDAFRDALKLKGSWNQILFSTLLASLGEKVPDGCTDWEDGVENWGVVFNGEEVISFVCEPIPIAFVKRRFSKDLNAIMNRFGVIHVDAEEFDAEIYRVDKTILKDVFVDVTDVVDYKCISLKDIWYATVTMPVRKD
ncbi:hypothetical protein [Rhizobium lusitanum]|uniref:Uncharacterized protein n=1 Tax=Rhizobium lusitanum TaxID=293958 RepID=A0A7X0ME32_9HYPH|nr:hypothetical protein [Rhizobium lusitanum]MBB6485620.1 hypothetical protein [Rhizobium lusitanum]